MAVRRSASALSVGDVEENSDAAAIAIGSGGGAVGLVEAQGATLEASSGVMQLDDAALGGLAGEGAKDDDEDEDPGSYNTAFEKWSQVHSLQKVLLRCKLNIRMIQFAEEALKVMTKTDQSALRKQLEQVEIEWLVFFFPHMCEQICLVEGVAGITNILCVSELAWLVRLPCFF